MDGSPYLGMAWRAALAAHDAGDCPCPSCSPPLCESCGERVQEGDDYCAECLEDVAIAEGEWRRDLEAAA